MLKITKTRDLCFCSVCGSVASYRLFAHSPKIIQLSAVAAFCDKCTARLKNIVAKITDKQLAKPVICAGFDNWCILDNVNGLTCQSGCQQHIQRTN